MTNDVQLLVDAHALVGEGPIWDEREQALYWVDIMSSQLYVYNPATGQNRAYDVGQHVGTVVLREKGGIMLAVFDGFAAFDLETGQLTLLNDPESHLPGNRFNDGKCDPAGRFWAGTMAYDQQMGAGGLYRMDTDFRVTRVLGGIGISNGIVWTADAATMYYIDSLAYNVRAFDYDNETGDIRNERVVIEVTEEQGLPDGMSIDAEGMLWVAHFGDSRIRRWNPTNGKVLDEIVLPATQITACAFGGEKLDTLFITGAAIGLDEVALTEQPHAGGLFSVQVDVQGVPAHRFGG